eukprot:CAMPEP_0117861898 /NCGR_PEP_ID=MMETSP0950-20121206/4635_1 /TAXON_ID=44440 /ORGANISM="Chattonella subsalsa, Strain CCMP2191" /LENGTH=217 /DNA_ID=CAMNT_0005712315 /DNA_START=122 /DNA_END=773 /DNA_ORIENTATION=+
MKSIRMKTATFTGHAERFEPCLQLVTLLMEGGQESDTIFEEMYGFTERVLKYDTLFNKSEEQDPEDKAETITVESKHPYSNSLDQLWEVEVPGADAMKIVFSENTRTERSHDKVIILPKQPCDQEGCRKYKIKRDDGALVQETAALDSTEVCTVPHNETVKVGEREWFHDKHPDPQHKEVEGFYRGKVVEPAKYAKGWISLKHHWVTHLDLDGNELE